MKRCPKCNCGAELTNNLKYYGEKTGALVVAFGAGVALNAVHPNPSNGAHASEIFRNLTENLRKHYKCTNCNCGYEWDEE